MERRPEPSDSPRSETVVDARTSLALWLRAGRAHRGMSLDDVAKVTKIQPRILERLEAGKLDGLPAEVFVRGFVRSFARCVGLDEREALRRYAACALGSQGLTPTVRALVEVMVDLAPGSASAARATPRKMQAVEVIDLAGPVVLTPPADPDPASAASPASVDPPGSRGTEADAPPVAELAAPIATAVEAPAPEAPAAQAVEPTELPSSEPASSEPAPEAPAPAAAVQVAPPAFTSKKRRSRRRKARAVAAAEAPHGAAGVPREPLAVGAPPTASQVVAPLAAEAVEPGAPWQPKPPGVPWRRLSRRVPAAPVRPSLVIDDADPESAERVQEERTERAGTLAPRRSFLPPILLDREDRSARQGGLTLAVILLLIAATLTLSYLMRRPSASGDGMTGREAPTQRAERS
jgi:cytoskeleton protein RodZ